MQRGPVFCDLHITWGTGFVAAPATLASHMADWFKSQLPHFQPSSLPMQLGKQWKLAQVP